MNRQAGFFRALADHLTSYPELAQVYVSVPGYDGRVTLQLDPRASQADLAAWAASLGATRLNVRRLSQGGVHLDAQGTVADHDVQVWCAAHDLDNSDLADGDRLQLEVLT